MTRERKRNQSEGRGSAIEDEGQVKRWIICEGEAVQAPQDPVTHC